MLIGLKPANDSKHKWKAYFSNGKTILFGAYGMRDYTLTGDKEGRRLFRIRHKKDLATKDPMRAGFLSYYLLWGDSTDIMTNIKSYNKKFFT